MAMMDYLCSLRRFGCLWPLKFDSSALCRMQSMSSSNSKEYVNQHRLSVDGIPNASVGHRTHQILWTGSLLIPIGRPARKVDPDILYSYLYISLLSQGTRRPTAYDG